MTSNCCVPAGVLVTLCQVVDAEIRKQGEVLEKRTPAMKASLMTHIVETEASEAKEGTTEAEVGRGVQALRGVGGGGVRHVCIRVRFCVCRARVGFCCCASAFDSRVASATQLSSSVHTHQPCMHVLW